MVFRAGYYAFSIAICVTALLSVSEHYEFSLQDTVQDCLILHGYYQSNCVFRCTLRPTVLVWYDLVYCTLHIRRIRHNTGEFC
jgi:hypothetical protein